MLYSGTVAAASEAALNDVPSIAVSLEWEEHPRFDVAATMAADLIEQMLERDAWERPPPVQPELPDRGDA